MIRDLRLSEVVASDARIPHLMRASAVAHGVTVRGAAGLHLVADEFHRMKIRSGWPPLDRGTDEARALRLILVFEGPLHGTAGRPSAAGSALGDAVSIEYAVLPVIS